MNLIQQITTYSLQKQSFLLSDGSKVSMTLSFKPMQNGWFIQTLSYGDFTITNIRVCVSPNILRQWKNLIPFGIACFSDQNREPMLQQDFSSGASRLYVLSEDEVKTFEDFLHG